MRYSNKGFTVLPTGTVEIAAICGMTALQYLNWKDRETVMELFKKYNRGRGKVSKQTIINKLSRLPAGDYETAVNNLIAYIQNV